VKPGPPDQRSENRNSDHLAPLNAKDAVNAISSKVKFSGAKESRSVKPRVPSPLVHNPTTDEGDIRKRCRSTGFTRPRWSRLLFARPRPKSVRRSDEVSG
jgi:hypothetical protein